MKKIVFNILFLVLLFCHILSQAQVFPGANETTPSKSQYFTWINNTNEGATAAQTKINLDFFAWLKREYGMQLDIYAFDAGAIDGKRFYGSIYSERFKKQFPLGFDPIYQQTKTLGIRLGVWGGPDGFGNTLEEEQARIDQMVKLCRDYNFALFKFDAVCGKLRLNKEDAFICMMKECRKYSPDLILLNHRLGLGKSKPYATTFLWEGHEMYIDVNMTNNVTAPHHRVGAMSRGLVPGLERLTEDHGVCISSCLDYWDDDLILQAFNRELILSPEIYGNPWLLNDTEFSKLARIFNLHRKYRDILVNGKQLPESYGPNAVTRGNKTTRILTMRNLSWFPVSYAIKLDKEIGIESKRKITLVQLHPTEKFLGTFKNGEAINIEVEPFRACMLLATTETYDDPLIKGTDFRVLKNISGQTIEIEILGMPGTKSSVSLLNADQYKSAKINGKEAYDLLNGKSLKLTFPGKTLKDCICRKLSDFTEIPIPVDVHALYEATVFAANNNALEVRSLNRSGETQIPEVKYARDAFFNQKAFVERGVWDRNLFDGDPHTGFYPSERVRDQRIEGGCLRIDLGKIQYIDQLLITVPDAFSLQPLWPGEGNQVEISTDLKKWKPITYLANTNMEINVGQEVRYFRFNSFPKQITEIEGMVAGKKLDRIGWRASNLFAYPRKKNAKKVWKTNLVLDEIPKGSYLCVAINGKHGVEGAYASAKIDGKLVGSSDRAPSFPSNAWEYPVTRSDRNYTYYIPLNEKQTGKNIEVYVMGYDKDNLNFKPELWINAYPKSWEKIKLSLKKK